jgi:uncharacterized Zn ribbon protein
MKNKRDNNSNTSKIDEVTQKLEELDIHIEQAIRVRRQLLKQRNETQNNNNNVARRELRDRDGNVIQIGDTVQFLTKGRYKSTQGVVTSVSSKLRITARDASGNLINRNSHNVIIKKKYYE